MKLTQLLEALDKRGIGEALLRGGEAMQTRVNGEWKPQGAIIPVGALGAMLESGAPGAAAAQWQSENRCQFEQAGYLIKAARRDDRVQVAVKRVQTSAAASAAASAAPFAEMTLHTSQTTFAPATTSTAVTAATSTAATAATSTAAKNALKPAVVEWYYLDEGDEKGPIAPDRMRVLISTGTIGGDTMVWCDGMTDWKSARDSDLRASLPASALQAVPVAPPLSPAAPIAAPGAPTTGSSVRTPFTVSTTGEEVALEEQRNKGAGWFYWIVGLTIINTLLAQTGLTVGFMLGSTATLGASEMAQVSGSSGARAAAMIFSVFVIAFYAMCGVMGSRGGTWAFILGLVAFTLDSLLLLLGLLLVGFGAGISSIFSIVIHGYALFCIFNGMMACVNLNRLKREKAITGMPVR